MIGSYNREGKMVFQTMGRVRSISIALVCGGFLCLLSILPPAHAQPAIQITAPASGTVVSPGATLIVSVALRSGVSVSQIIIVGENPIGFSEALAAAPFQFPVTIPTSINAGLYHLTADATGAEGQDLQSAPIMIDVEPSVGISFLKIQPRLIQLAIGESASLTVMGTLVTGTQMDLTNSTLISFTSSNTGVATVSQGGAVTVVGAGFAYITISGPGLVPFAIPVFAAPAIQPSADLSVTQSASLNPAAGTTLTYTITVHNAGPSDAPNVVVTDILPAGVTFASGPCTGTAVVLCNMGTLPSGSGKDLAIQAKIPASFLSKLSKTTAQVVNKISVSSSISDPNLTNNVSSLTTTVSSAAYMTLTMIGAPDSVHEGSAVTYTMSFTNVGPSDAIQGFILDYLPTGFEFVSSSVLPCGGGIGAVLCDLGPVVPAGFTLNFPIQVSVPANFLPPGKTSANVINTAMIYSETVDPHPGNNPASVATTIVH
jgi:uncharacterized repeat protein (TIGR01451 family)